MFSEVNYLINRVLNHFTYDLITMLMGYTEKVHIENA